MYEVEHVLAIQNILGEGPLWHVDEQALYWIDIIGKQFFTYVPRSGQLQSFDLSQTPDSWLSTKAGRCSWQLMPGSQCGVKDN